MLCRLLVTREKAKEVSVEHVNAKKLYAVMEPACADPMLIRLDRDAGKIYCADFSTKPWTAHTIDSDPNTTSEVILEGFINRLLKEKDRKVYEFDTLFEFSSWLIDLKQERIEIPTDSTDDNSKYRRIMLTGGSKTIHYSNKNAMPLCGIIPTYNTWRSDKEVTCVRCRRIVNTKSDAFKNIDLKTNE